MNKPAVLFVLFCLFLQFGLSQEEFQAGFIERTCRDFIPLETVSYITFPENFLLNMAEEDKEVSQIASKLLALHILKSDTTNAEVNDELYSRVITAVHHEGYELLSEIDSEDASSHYYRKNGDKKKRTTEILMISKATDGCLLISALGEEININQLKKLSKR